MEGSYKFKLMSISFFLFLFLSAYVSPAIARKNRIVPLSSHNKTSSSSSGLQTYIVRLQRSSSTASSSKDEDDWVEWYKSFLPADTVTTNEEGKSTTSSRLVHAYKKVVTGFAARLTEAELAQIKEKDEFLHAFPDRLLPLQTTHTSDFLGLHRGTAGFWSDSNYGKGVIIGVLDTGILPDHPSFGDAGMPPPPSKWKGVCEFNASSCNNKLIGARNFVKGRAAAMEASDDRLALLGPYDHDGHGTHTASTAAGAFVENANVAGQANGTASGMAPLAHVAIYKVCGDKCADSDILAGLDAAVSDGVDILSLSLGGSSIEFYNDATAIGTFGAIENGIFVSCAAGNDGPSWKTLSNEAPWMLTVGASTTDRSIRSTVQLGSGVDFVGESLVQPSNYASPKLPLIYPGFAGSSGSALCLNGSLRGLDVKGMIVLCDEGEISRVAKGWIVKSAGGAGMIIASAKSSGYILRDDVHVLPTSHVSYSDGLTIKSYINGTTSPTASISFEGTVLGTSPAPMVAGFSSRGPNQADPSILKPDIIGPGVNILAAWPFQVEATNNVASSTFNIISGTSMSTPHLSGIAALLKSSHPAWSPAMIKSAMMTTAYLNANHGDFIPDQAMKRADFFATGAGHVNASRANNPGLVYDIASDDYIAYLCGIPYTSAQVSTIVGRRVTCSGIAPINGTNLNYPSFVVFLSAANGYTASVSRTVTYVGAGSRNYTVQVAYPAGTSSVTVKPTTLSFTKVDEKAEYTVTFFGRVSSGSASSSTSYSEGYLTWSSDDESTDVNSPIMVAIR
ncbi:subtilisin-like protease SBT1.2 [Iris pallida]|uniref:Subtilisin-like protease SBT1.2 n=1 Tax=Iris pallida TaxID=29817 RepID=A0AAX6FEZ3_IRIPA|nr:subtilisin-like protease SBT1.2 [Iris pallida]